MPSPREPGARLVIPICRLKCLKGHRSQTSNTDIGSLTDPHQEPRMWTTPPSSMAVAILNPETTTGERVHRYTHARHEPHQPGNQRFILHGLNVERQRMLRRWTRRGSEANDLAHPNRLPVVVEREE